MPLPRTAGIAAVRRVCQPAPLRMTTQASFMTSAKQLAAKEDKLHTDAETRTAEIESATRDSVDKARSGKGEWKEELASSSESIIKAEKGEVKASEKTIKKLQEESIRLGASKS